MAANRTPGLKKRSTGNWKPDGTDEPKRELRPKDGVGGLQGLDKEGITAKEASIIARGIILDHLADGPWRKKLLIITEKKRPILSFFYDLDIKYFDNSSSKETSRAQSTFQDFKWHPNSGDLLVAGQVHDNYRDEYEFIATDVNFTPLEKWECFQVFLDLEKMPNIFLKDAVAALNKELKRHLKGVCSDDSLEHFRDSLEGTVEDLRVKGIFAMLEDAATPAAYPGHHHPPPARRGHVGSTCLRRHAFRSHLLQTLREQL